jgi:hypothetical protein
MKTFLQMFFVCGWALLGMFNVYHHQWRDAGIAFGLAYCGGAKRVEIP